VSRAADAPLVAAVIVTWNSASTIGECLRTLLASSLSSGIDIVVVDNASTDRTADVVTDTAPEARLIRNQSNLGLAAANNQGIEATDAPWVLISNPDVVYEPTTVAQLVACGDRHETAAFVIARLSYPDGSLQTSVGDLPTFAQAFLGRRASAARRGTSGFWWDGWAHDEERLVGHGAESCYLVRRAAVEAIGAQDPRYFLDWEGIDWADRARAGGWEVWFTPDARAVHIEGVSIRQARLSWVLRTHRGMYRYFSSSARAPVRGVIGLLVTVRALAKLAVVGARLVLEKVRR
jgi:N-acetylglucosaminyl-diphospho-decaprenol L-rhamnosyltransferase